MLHGVDEQLGALGKLVAADADRRLEGQRFGLVQKRLVDARVEHFDVVVQPVVIRQAFLDSSAARENRQRRGQVEPINVPHDERGKVVKLDVRALAALDRTEEIVERPRMVIEEHHLPGMSHGIGSRLRAEHDLVARHVECLELVDQREVQKELTKQPELRGLDGDGKVADVGHPRVDQEQINLMAPASKTGDQLIDDDLESTCNAVVRLDDGNFHGPVRFRRSSRLSSSAIRSVRT